MNVSVDIVIITACLFCPSLGPGHDHLLLRYRYNFLLQMGKAFSRSHGQEAAQWSVNQAASHRLAAESPLHPGHLRASTGLTPSTGLGLDFPFDFCIK